MAPAPEPKLGADPTAETLDAFDTAVLTWGRIEHGKVVRLCQWFADMGVKQLDCTP